MEQRRLAKPKSNETVENAAVYVCEVRCNSYCPNNAEPGCGESAGGSGCPCANIKPGYGGGSTGSSCPYVNIVIGCGGGCRQD